jgi:hypothetical protein
MFNLVAVSAIALSLAASVSSLAVPRATPPPGWNTPLLESYDTYHTRYMALACNTKHGVAFFDQCCHPLLATQSLASRPAQCNPVTSAKPAPPVATPSSSPDDDDDDDLPFCDDDDGDDDDDSATPVVPATTKAAPAVTSHPAVVTTPAAPAPPKKAAPPPPPAPAQPAAKPSTNSPSGVNTGGFATFFYQNGVAGACGTVHKDSDMIAAIDQGRYGNSGAKSSLCGQQVKITNTKNQKSVTVTIADDCPTCDNDNSIDLSSGAFQKIATLDEGLVPISWSFV